MKWQILILMGVWMMMAMSVNAITNSSWYEVKNAQGAIPSTLNQNVGATTYSFCTNITPKGMTNRTIVNSIALNYTLGFGNLNPSSSNIKGFQFCEARDGAINSCQCADGKISNITFNGAGSPRNYALTMYDSGSGANNYFISNQTNLTFSLDNTKSYWVRWQQDGIFADFQTALQTNTCIDSKAGTSDFEANTGWFTTTPSCGAQSYSFYNLIMFDYDTIPPQINASFNNLSSAFAQYNRINMTANVSDNSGLSFCKFSDNMTGTNNFFNKSVTGLGDQCSQNYTLAFGTFNFTVFVNDSSNNINYTSQIITTTSQNNITPTIIINTPLNNSQTHNLTSFINFTINTTSPNLNITFEIYLDTLSNPSTRINRSENFTAGNYTFFYTLSNQVAGSINGTYYLKINGTDNASNFFSIINSFNVTNNISNYNATNVSIMPLLPAQGTTLTGYCNLTSHLNEFNNLTMNRTRWWINGTIVSSNESTLLGANVTLNSNITFMCAVNNGYGETAWTQYVNSSTIIIGDTTAPIITAQAINSQSLITTDILNISLNCTDINSISYVRTEINKTNSTMTSLGNNVYSLNGQASSLFTVGLHNITNFYCADGSGNIARDQSNFTFTVSNPPSGGSSSSGGGGGGGGVTCPAGFTLNASSGRCINATTIIQEVSNCNQNGICEAKNGEDPFACPTDCKINANYLTCDDPTQNCIFNLFDAKNKAVRIGTFIALGSIFFLAITNYAPNSSIGKLFKRKKKGS